MLMYLYGPDTYRRNRAVREITAKYKEKYPDGSIGTFDCEEKDAVRRLETFVAGAGLFAKTSIAVVYHPEDGEKPLVKLLKGLMDAKHVTVVVVGDKKPTKDFSFLLGDEVTPKNKEYELMGLPAMERFLGAEAASLGLTLSASQIKDISVLAGGDSWAAVSEAYRFAFGAAKPERKESYDFLSCIRTLSGGRDAAARLRALTLLMEYEDSAKIFNMLGGFARGAAVATLADYDIAIKRGQLEYGDALLDYALG